MKDTFEAAIERIKSSNVSTIKGVLDDIDDRVYNKDLFLEDEQWPLLSLEVNKMVKIFNKR
tara:strand:- start:889 stop:1071 length:183 start_codon:yes stop_codon:yes gene_type:complete